MNVIAIIGCGWLGKILARKFLSMGYVVKGTSTSLAGVNELCSRGISGTLLNLDTASTKYITEFIDDAPHVIIAVPPKHSNYARWMQKFSGAIPSRQIIFTSSTSVYGNASGLVDENSAVVQGLLADAENALPGAVILRLAGLTGPGRHPVQHLSGRIGIADPDAPINLVHSDDVTEAISRCVRLKVEACTINIVAPWHPSRKEYYQSQAEKRGLPLPQFAASGNLGKTVRSIHVQSILGFEPDPQLLK